ncbi:uncharacterized protein A1O9_11667, partial [Exophiala aquamarina CBS 119918]
LFGFYIPTYAALGYGYADITHLMTYPTLFMGIGNIIGMPIAIAVGRRIVLLASTVILVVSAVLCACATNYEWHLAARMVLGLAAGQSEALVPLIIQEIFFVHERSTFLMAQQLVQTTFTSVWVLFAGPIAGKITPGWWDGLGAILAGVQLIAAFLLLPETKYNRPMASFQESSFGTGGHGDSESSHVASAPALNLFTHRPSLDFDKYAPRTFRPDIRLWVDAPDWNKAAECLVQMFQLLFFLAVFWALLLNGLTLGVDIAIGTTYGNIVTSPPYNWPQNSASYANCGQIIVAFIGLPLLGQFSDTLIQWRARRNEGIHEPEARLIPLILPIVVGIFTAVLYGQGAANTTKYHWFVYVWAIAAYFFAFIGANIVAITYLLDSYPARAGPILVIICAFCGIISFGVSYGIAPFIERCGYDGAFNAFGGLTGALGLLGVVIYVFGKKFRAITGKYAKDKN